MRIWSIVGAASLVLVCFLAAAPSADAALCKSKKGKLTVRNTCKKKEISLTAGDIPQPPPQPPPKEQTPAGPRVVDSKGDEVGALMNTFSYYGGGGTVLREISGQLYSFSVKRSGLGALEDENTFFTYLNADCTGAPYLGAGYGSLSRATTNLKDRLARNLDISKDATTGYYVTEEGVVDTRSQVNSTNIQRSSSVEGAFLDCFPPDEKPVGEVAACDSTRFCGDAPRCFCRLCCSKRGNYVNILAPARSLDLRPLGLTPPFKIER